jgi:hypothetical protein
VAFKVTIWGVLMVTEFTRGAAGIGFMIILAVVVHPLEF